MASFESAVNRFGRGHGNSAIYGTSLLFAAMHSGVWPSPIALFVLGLGLGWLAYRTRSLVGASWCTLFSMAWPACSWCFTDVSCRPAPHPVY